MEFKPESIDRIKGIIYGVLGLGVFFNFAALAITVYMLNNFSWMVYESNPLPAYVFANFGYLPQFFIMISFWIGVFAMLKFWGKRCGSKRQLVLAGMFAVILTSMAFWDFSNNFYYLTKVCLPTVII